MKNELKVGQICEVVEVRTNGGYTVNNLFKIGGHSIMHSRIYCLINGESGLFKGEDKYLCMSGNDVKPIGRLTVKKVK